MAFQIIKIAIKFLVTFFCFFIIAKKINYDETLKLFNLISNKTIIISSIIFLLHYFAVTSRWQFYTYKLNYNISYMNALRITSLGLFTNQVFFGNIAMDAVRVMYLKKNKNISVGLGSVFLDRFTALQSMWLILTLIFVFNYQFNFNNSSNINNFIQFICYVGLLTVILPLITIFKFEKLKNNFKLIKFFFEISRIYKSGFESIKNFSKVYITSFLILTSSGIVTWMIADDLSVQLKFWDSLLITLLGLLITALPISINGWGLREISFISLLGTQNINAEESIIISITFGLLLLISSVIGIIFYFLREKKS